MIPILDASDSVQKMHVTDQEIDSLFDGRETELFPEGSKADSSELAFTAEFRIGEAVVGRLKDGRRAALIEDGNGFFFLYVKKQKPISTSSEGVGASLIKDMA